jgi:hypothetical protein
MKPHNTLLIVLSAVLLLACGGKKKGSEGAENGDLSVSDITFYLEQKTTVTEAGGSMVMVSKGWHDVKNNYFAVELEYESFFAGERVPHRGLYLQNNTGTYQIDLIRKTGYKLEDDDLEDYEDPLELYNEDPKAFERAIVADGGKILGRETILGRECIVVEFGDYDGDDEEPTIMKYWFYKGIPLKSVGDGILVESVKFEQGAAIPAGAFNIPEGVTIR